MRTLKAGGAEVPLARVQPAVHPGRRRGRAGRRVRHRDLRPPGRGPRHLLRPPPNASRTSIPHDHHGRRLRPRVAAPQGAARPAARGPRRHRGDHHGRHPPPRDGRRRRARRSRSSPSTRPRPSTCSTTATAPVSRPSTASCARRTSSSPGATSSIAGYGWVGRGIASRMAGMGAHVAVIEVDPVRGARGAHGRLPGHDRRRGGAAGATCSSPRPATSTSSGASTSRRCATARSWPTPATSTPSWT